MLSTVVLGESFNLVPTAKSLNWRERILVAFANIKNMHAIRPQKMTFTTGNDSSFSTAAIGLVVVEHAHGSTLSRNILPDTHINDGMCHAMIMAPRSVMEIFRFFLCAPIHRIVSRPNFLGLLKTKSFTVKNGNTLNYKLDGQHYQTEQLNLATESRVLKLLASEALPIFPTSPSHKEQRKITRLPTGEAIKEMISKELPFITHRRNR
ncbi:hypothetical protein ACLKMH_15400 [Psychromonas sp. KJ10-10]|uniref:hypothetical protein n=1 Tax=Psychromonas sp. KJ10-10 TaxID=3391823 RepID=UPI0039B60245